MVIYGIFIMAVGKAAMHRSYLYPHNPTFGALSQGRARFFCAKAGAALLFQHKACWARELRSNTPCPGSTFSCTDCLVHTNRAGDSPLTNGGFFTEPQLGVALCGARGFAAPRGGRRESPRSAERNSPRWVSAAKKGCRSERHSTNVPRVPQIVSAGKIKGRTMKVRPFPYSASCR